jgi:demethylmenaquinone methyltransferase/2-methoxy-6-polyprenyl-1,4-benzoquinol methylase
MTAGRDVSSTRVDKTPSRIAGMFDAIAPRYDLLNHLLSAGLDRRWRTRAVRALELPRNATVLDLCTGTADLALAIAGSAADAQVVGIDFAAGMLRLGQDKVRAAGMHSRIHLVRGDATRIPLADACCDGATVAFGIRNVSEPERALAEMARILRPGGRLAILEFAQPRLPGLRTIYSLYFRFVLPAIGRLVSRHESAYSYLPASVGSFPPPGRFLQSCEAAGFTAGQAVPLSLGIVYLYTARRRD